MAKWFQKVSNGAKNFFHKVKDGAANFGKKAVDVGKKIEHGLSQAANVGQKVIGGLEKGLSTASTLFPELAPVLGSAGAVMGGLNKGLGYVNTAHGHVQRANAGLALMSGRASGEAMGVAPIENQQVNSDYDTNPLSGMSL